MNNHTEIPITTNSNNINNPNNPYVHISPAPPSSASNNNNRPNQTLDSICDGFNRCSRTVEKAARHAENMVDNFWNHIRISSSPADAAMARIVQGTRALTNGGSDKLFQQTFGFVPGERLLKPFACYISTTSGPVIGTLYVSNKRVAFCSDYPICHHPMSFQHHRSSCIYYKVTGSRRESATDVIIRLGCLDYTLWVRPFPRHSMTQICILQIDIQHRLYWSCLR
ncbi:GEM-like protein 2 isoform X3 [Arachis hypogaea]|uniref:GEM-like protein 2 isoform X3 n=1 Tax=Arachis hypogaea TaxID=3818 RepID=UPI000DED883D|nr:GEM-like protein 2 isoform X4 [Arachis hypogaea]